jgi:hypothetical protein
VAQDGRLTPQRHAERERHTGLKNDSVGPGEYEPVLLRSTATGTPTLGTGAARQPLFPPAESPGDHEALFFKIQSQAAAFKVVLL